MKYVILIKPGQKKTKVNSKRKVNLLDLLLMVERLQKPFWIFSGDYWRKDVKHA